MTLVRYAVVFKTHFWDDFAQRQFNQLLKCAGTNAVYLLIDETHGSVGDIDYDNVIRMTEQNAIQDGYYNHPEGNLFWYNTDYQLYHFIDLHPEFDYIVTSEYDCFVNFDIGRVIETMHSEELEFVGHLIPTEGQRWDWVYYARPYYAKEIDISGRLLCFAIFGRSLALRLQIERRNQTLAAKDGLIFSEAGSNFVWPNNEAFVGTEIARSHVREAPLSAFVDVSHYEWSPPYYEPIIDTILSDNCIIHPVLTGSRYIRSIVKCRWKIQDVYTPDTYLYGLMQTRPIDEVTELFFPYFLNEKDYASIRALQTYAGQRGNFDPAVFNILKGKPATQSSTCKWSLSQIPAVDAARAVSGRLDHPDGFHTDQEDAPWWCVDLEYPMPVCLIRIFNRLAYRERANSLSAQVSLDTLHWREIYSHAGEEAFGGIDGNPLIIKLDDRDSPREIRFIRLQINGPEVFHLQQVEAYL